MKFFVVFCLIAVGGVRALAQQRGDWRPSLAEDNKAATWEDTFTFLSTLRPPPDPVEGQWVFGYPLKVSSTARCLISFDTNKSVDNVGKPSHWTQSYHNFNMTLSRLTIDLNHLDPLEIAVVPMPNTAQQWQITMKSTPGTETFTNLDSVYSVYIDKAGNELRILGTPQILKSLKIPCGPVTEAKSCVDKQTVSAEATLTLLTIDSAKRYARALMHAALLCGGAKAVSPF